GRARPVVAEPAHPDAAEEVRDPQAHAEGEPARGDLHAAHCGAVRAIGRLGTRPSTKVLVVIELSRRREVGMLIRIDAESTRPIFEQIAASVRADIVAGRLSAGDRLPPAREIAGALDINLHTVLHAYQQLRDESLVDLRRGRGAVVSHAAAPLAELR